MLYDKLNTGKMHGLYMSNVSRCDEPSRMWATTAQWILYTSIFTLPFRLQNDLYHVGWGVKIHSITHCYMTTGQQN